MLVRVLSIMFGTGQASKHGVAAGKGWMDDADGVSDRRSADCGRATAYTMLGPEPIAMAACRATGTVHQELAFAFSDRVHLGSLL